MINIIQADYHNAKHGEMIVALMNIYASSPFGGGKGLALDVQSQLVMALQKRTDAVSLLALDGENAVALLNAFEGFSTFNCQPLLNIHDLIVIEPYRNQGVAQLLFREVESIARHRDCCKLTLEVLAENRIAQSCYRRFGFSAYELDPHMGQALFWEKPLHP